LSWIRSPFLHFLVLGSLLFAVNSAREASVATDEAAASRIEIDAEKVDMLIQDFASQMGRRPEPPEIERLLASEIDEEILFREAIDRGLLERDGGVQTRLIQKMLFLEGETKIEEAGALLRRAVELELHKDDIVVRRILIQKMRLYGSMLTAEEQPSNEEIAARYAETRESLREDDRINFVHVFLSADDRRENTMADAAALRSSLARESVDANAAIERGDPFPLGYRFGGRSERDMDRSFGARFGAEALASEIGEWSQPIESAYGAHLLWIDRRDPGLIPPLEAVTDRIRRELERERQEAKLEALLSDLQKRYEVVVMDASKEMG